MWSQIPKLYKLFKNAKAIEKILLKPAMTET